MVSDNQLATAVTGRLGVTPFLTEKPEPVQTVFKVVAEIAKQPRRWLAAFVGQLRYDRVRPLALGDVVKQHVRMLSVRALDLLRNPAESGRAERGDQAAQKSA